MKMPIESFDLENVYDEEIAPLMTKIIEICKAHKLPMLATFMYGYRQDDDDHDFCTTMLLWKDRGITRQIYQADDLIRGNLTPALRMSIKKADGTIIEEVIIPE